MRHVKAVNLSCSSVRRLLHEGNGAISGVAEYSKPLLWLDDAYKAAIRANLRIDRQTWTIRDDNGERSRPSNLAEWPECTMRDANFELARAIWCDAVRLHNIATGVV